MLTDSVVGQSSPLLCPVLNAIRCKPKNLATPPSLMPCNTRRPSSDISARTVSPAWQFLFCRTANIWLFLAIIAFVYVYNAWSPSSYALSLRLVGAAADGLILGSPREVRSDEYLVLTPYMQIAVRNNFEAYNKLSPYKEPLKSAYALPVLDWSIIFKPQLWGFFALSPARAYSLYYCALMISFCLGYTILLRQLGAGGSISILVAITFFSCHFVQVWWTNNAPTFALAPWPLIIHLTRLRWYFKAPLIFYAACVWLLSLLYPPFIIGAAFAFGMLLVAFRSDQAKTTRVLVPSGLAVLAAVGIVLVYFGDLIIVMRNSFYPGQREYAGGGLPWSMLTANLLPNFATRYFEPIFSGPDINPSEVGVVSSFLPLTILAFCNRHSLLRLFRQNPMCWSVWAVGYGLVLAWQVLPLPPWVGRALLWHIVASNRLQWGGGLILMLGLGVMASSIRWRFTLVRTMIVTSLVVIAWIYSKYIMAGVDRNSQINWGGPWFDCFFLLPLWIAFLATHLPFDWSQQLRRRTGETLVAAVMVTNVATFGTFNPIQSAWPIFSEPSSPFLQSLRKMAAAHPQGQVAIEGAYGAVLNGLGIPAINHSLLTPNVKFFRERLPELSDEAAWLAFNRYAQIVPSAVRDVEIVSRDGILVPIHRFGLNLPVDIEDTPKPEEHLAIQGNLDSFNRTPLRPGVWKIDVRGWCYCGNWAAGQRIIIRPSTAFEGRATIVDGRAVRLPRVDVARTLENEKLSYSGYLLSFELLVDELGGAPTVHYFDLFSDDPVLGKHRIHVAR